VKELLETILTIVSERRHKHSQQAELAKRNLADADRPHLRTRFGNAFDYHRSLEARYQSLFDEINAVISEELGDDWRSPSKPIDRTADMVEAHGEGLHSELPREGCPECES
jgi:hypothetical protein